MKVLALHLKCRPKAKCKAHLCQPSVGNKKYLPSLFFLMMVYTKESQLWTLESFTTWSSRFINHSSKIMWMFYQQLTWNVSLREWEELPVLGLFSSCQMPLTVLNTAQQRNMDFYVTYRMLKCTFGMILELDGCVYTTCPH